MEQCSHQILKSDFAFSIFATCRAPDGLLDIGRGLLESDNNRTGVIRLVLAFVDGTRQHERRRRRSWPALDTLAVIDSK